VSLDLGAGVSLVDEDISVILGGQGDKPGGGTDGSNSGMDGGEQPSDIDQVQSQGILSRRQFCRSIAPHCSDISKNMKESFLKLLFYTILSLFCFLK